MFGRQPAATVQTVTVQDAFIATAWGLSDTAWAGLTDSERTDYRDRVVYAPNFGK